MSVQAADADGSQPVTAAGLLRGPPLNWSVDDANSKPQGDDDMPVAHIVTLDGLSTEAKADVFDTVSLVARGRKFQANEYRAPMR